jgi:hypothetical protein
LFESIAKETQLGFATNMAVNEGDKRWIYCDNKSYMDLLNNEITRSGTDAQICDYWIDWWNNIVLADIYERYNTKDKDEDMQIWIAGTQKDASEGFETKPQQTVATLHNHPSQAETELYIKRFEVISTFGSQMYEGTDKVFSVYETNKLEYMDYLVQDGDVHKDIFTKYEYLGEVYGDFNYLLQNKKREAFIQKINTNETIKVTLRSPLLGIMRGNHINILWYYNDDRVNSLKNKLAEAGVTNAVEPNIDIPLDDEMDTNSSAGQFVLDRTKSGQYLITGCRMKYDNVNLWSYELTLSRSSINKQSILKDE